MAPVGLLPPTRDGRHLHPDARPPVRRGRAGSPLPRPRRPACNYTWASPPARRPRASIPPASRQARLPHPRAGTRTGVILLSPLPPLSLLRSSLLALSCHPWGPPSRPTRPPAKAYTIQQHNNSKKNHNIPEHHRTPPPLLPELQDGLFFCLTIQKHDGNTFSLTKRSTSVTNSGFSSPLVHSTHH